MKRKIIIASTALMIMGVACSSDEIVNALNDVKDSQTSKTESKDSKSDSKDSENKSDDKKDASKPAGECHVALARVNCVLKTINDSEKNGTNLSNTAAIKIRQEFKRKSSTMPRFLNDPARCPTQLKQLDSFAKKQGPLLEGKRDGFKMETFADIYEHYKCTDAEVTTTPKA